MGNAFIDCEIGNGNVYYAALSSSGIGSWTSTTSIGGAYTGIDCQASGLYVYCVGIYTTTFTDEIAVGTLSSTGAVSSWNTASYTYPVSNNDQGCAIISSKLYCVGGFNGPIATGYYSTVSSGTLSSWTQFTSYPVATGEMNCVDYSSELTCVGGATGNDGVTPTTSVYSYSGGSSGTWTQASNSYPLGIISHNEQGCVTDGSSYIVCVGGYSGNAGTNVGGVGGVSTTAAYFVTSSSVGAQSFSVNLPITFTNAQTSSTASGLQVKAAFPWYEYASLASASMGNVRFFSNSADTHHLYSWLEQLGSPNYDNSLFWVNLGNVTIAGSSGTATIYATFLSTSTTFDAVWAGESPTIPGTYAEYDNGANVFNFYDNFAGTSLSSKWTVSGVTYSVNNGITMTAAAATNDYITSSSFTASTGVVDFYGYIWGTSTPFVETGFTTATSSNNYATAMQFYPGDGVFGIQGGSAGQVNSGQVSASEVTGIYSVAVTSSTTSSFSLNYGTPATLSSSDAPSYPLPIGLMKAGSGTFSTSLSYNWIRERTLPPSDVLPSYTFGDLQTTISSITISIKASTTATLANYATISISGCSTNSTSLTGNGKYAHFSVTPSCSSLTLTMPTAGATRYFFSKGLNTSESFTTPSVSTSYSFNYEAQFRITNDQQTTITYTGNSTQATSAASSIYVDAGTNFTTLSYYAVSWEATGPAYLTYINGSSFPFPVLTNTTITGITLSSGNELVTFNASHLYARTYTGTNVLGILQNGAAAAYSEGPSGIFYFSGVGPTWAIELGSSGSSGPSGGPGGEGGTGGTTSSSSSSSAASSNSSSAPEGQTGGNNPGQVFSNLPNPLQPLGLPPAAFYIPVLILLLFLLMVYAYTKKADAERELDHLNAGLRRSMSPGPYGRQARKQGRKSWFSTRPKRRRRRV